MAANNTVNKTIQDSQPGEYGLQRIKGNALQASAVTPSDATAVFFDALYIGTAGALAVEMLGRPGEAGNVLTFTAVPVGILPISVVRVLSTGTVASNIIGLNW